MSHLKGREKRERFQRGRSMDYCSSSAANSAKFKNYSVRKDANQPKRTKMEFYNEKAIVKDSSCCCSFGFRRFKSTTS